MTLQKQHAKKAHYFLQLNNDKFVNISTINE